MVKSSQHRRTDSVRTFSQQLGRLADDFARLTRQAAEQKKAAHRDEKAQYDSLRKGMERIQARIAELEEAGGWHRHYFNVFDVIERTYCEQTHSNVLAWLLDPTEAHGFGDVFLKAFVKTVFDEDLGDTTDVVVKREYKILTSKAVGICDIVIWQRADWVLIIENKVYSTQGVDQLLKYAGYWRKRVFHKRYFSYLTRNGEPPNCKDFVSVPYHTVRRLLTNLRGNEEVEYFIRHFVDHIWFT